jgi:hypothetical protein
MPRDATRARQIPQRRRSDSAAQTARALGTLPSMLSLQCTSQRGNPGVFDDQ